MRAALFISALASAAVGVVTAAEELKIDVTVKVNCERKTQKGDNVEMHYRGTLAGSGKQFDASYDRGQTFSFKLGAGQVIKGWDQGLLDMCIGEKRTLTIPPELGYGSRGIGPIPGGSTLVFETELVGIKGVPKPETIDYVTVESATEAASEAVESASEAAESATEKLAEKIASVVADAADAAATLIADTDEAVQAHEEL